MAVFVASSVAAGARKPVKLAEHERNRATRKHRQVIGIARKIALPGLRTPVRRADDGLDRQFKVDVKVQQLTFVGCCCVALLLLLRRCPERRCLASVLGRCLLVPLLGRSQEPRYTDASLEVTARGLP